MSEDTTCPNISKPTRTLAYYIQGGIGIFLLISNTLSIFGAGNSLILSIILLLTASLWIMSPKYIIKKLTNQSDYFLLFFLFSFLVLLLYFWKIYFNWLFNFCFFYLVFSFFCFKWIRIF